MRFRAIFRAMEQWKRETGFATIERPDETLNTMIEKLSGRRALVVATSNRWKGEGEVAKSTLLAQVVAKEAGATFIDASKLRIATCEGNISSIKGNKCGVKGALLKDPSRNSGGIHRCWASINNPDDELWRVSKPLLESDVVVFFASVRWGQTNSVYQRLIERLSWIENRWTTLGEENVLQGVEAGIVLVGHNWNGEVVLETQRRVLSFFGFDVPANLSFGWQWTQDEGDETQEGYKADPKDFGDDFGIVPIESLLRGKRVNP